ncbi:MAG: TVP38/TMEM64 family protein, partial [Dehalococcoidia bacterium]|nr:TVP38/TMEM64 family protein [Dehalococcoidia bacterium]
MLSKRDQAILVVLLGIALVALYYFSSGLRANVDQVIGIVARGDVQGLRAYLLSFGIWAPVVSAAIMLIHSIIPFPAVVITLANGLLFGAFWGTILSWSTAMVGAALCYVIAKALGRPVVERLVGAKGLRVSDDFFDRYGTHAVLITRLIPVVSFDLISYAAGLTKIGFIEFMVATGIGQLPATVVYSVLGENLTGGVKVGLLAFGAVAALFVLGFAVKA